MADALALPLGVASPPVGVTADKLGRYYTRLPDAHAFVRALPWDGAALRRAFIPSVGSGAWPLALRARWPHLHIVGVDLDPLAPALHLPPDKSGCDTVIQGDWRQVAPTLGDADLVVDNIPFALFDAFLIAAFNVAPRVAFLVQDTVKSALLEEHYADVPGYASREELILSRPWRAVLTGNDRLRFEGRKGQSPSSHSVHCWDATWRGDCAYRLVDLRGGRGDLVALANHL